MTEKHTYSLDDIQSEILKKLDYSLKFAHDRTELVNILFAQNEWVYDLISTDKLIQKEHKKKTSFLAEDQAYDSMIERISSYVTQPKFKNQEDKDKYEAIIEKKKALSGKKKLTDKQRDSLFHLEGLLSSYNNRIAPDKFNMEQTSKQENEEKETKMDAENIVDFSKSKEIVRMRTTQTQKFDITFWDRMGYNENQKAERNEMLNNLEAAIHSLKALLGYGYSNVERSEIQAALLSSMEDKKYIVGKKTVQFSRERQLMILNQMYSQLKSEWSKTLLSLTDQFTFKRLDSTSTEYVWDEDTWYIDESGEIVELSKNIVTYSDVNYYNGMLLTYNDLLSKYETANTTDMWAMLKDFEMLLERVELDEVESEIVGMLLTGIELQEVAKIIRQEHGISKNKFYRIVEQYIPNKLKDKYIEETDEWLYTEKMKGKYKTCSKCGSVKLVNDDRYFTKKNDAKDGFHPYCKTCRK